MYEGYGRFSERPDSYQCCLTYCLYSLHCGHHLHYCSYHSLNQYIYSHYLLHQSHCYICYQLLLIKWNAYSHVACCVKKLAQEPVYQVLLYNAEGSRVLATIRSFVNGWWRFWGIFGTSYTSVMNAWQSSTILVWVYYVFLTVISKTNNCRSWICDNCPVSVKVAHHA